MFNELFNELPQGSSKNSGKYESKLPAEVLKTLEEFTEWLVKHEGKTVATSQSYKSYVAKALALKMSGDQMTSDIRSGIKALKRFTVWQENQ